MSSIINKVMTDGKSVLKPVVGMGATICMWSDRRAATIVKVLTPTTIVIQQDEAIRSDTNGMSESQEYHYKRWPTAPHDTYTRRKNGSWVRKGEPMKNGQRISLGHRSHYHDFSF